MKANRLVMLAGGLVVLAGVALAQVGPDGTFQRLRGNEVQATKVIVPASGLTIGGTVPVSGVTAQTATKAATVTPQAGATVTATAVVTPQAGATVTATAVVTPQTFVPTYILADGTTNEVAIVTNATVAVTVANGAGFLTNATAAITVANGAGLLTNVTVSTAGVVTNVAVAR